MGEGAGPNRPADGVDRWKGVGKVGDTSQWEVRQGDGDELSKSGELRQIDGNELSCSNELSDAGKLAKVNDEARRAESMSITSLVEVGGDTNGKIVPTNSTW